jgi:hypothetical protein
MLASSSAANNHPLERCCLAFTRDLDVHERALNRIAVISDRDWKRQGFLGQGLIALNIDHHGAHTKIGRFCCFASIAALV